MPKKACVRRHHDRLIPEILTLRMVFEGLQFVLQGFDFSFAVIIQRESARLYP